MTKEDYNRATNILEQIDKIEVLSSRVAQEYRKSDDTDLKEVLNKCDEALTVLKEINQEKFDKL